MRLRDIQGFIDRYNNIVHSPVPNKIKLQRLENLMADMNAYDHEDRNIQYMVKSVQAKMYTLSVID